MVFWSSWAWVCSYTALVGHLSSGTVRHDGTKQRVANFVVQGCCLRQKTPRVFLVLRGTHGDSFVITASMNEAQARDPLDGAVSAWNTHMTTSGHTYMPHGLSDHRSYACERPGIWSLSLLGRTDRGSIISISSCRPHTHDSASNCETHKRFRWLLLTRPPRPISIPSCPPHTPTVPETARHTKEYDGCY